MLFSAPIILHYYLRHSLYSRYTIASVSRAREIQSKRQPVPVQGREFEDTGSLISQAMRCVRLAIRMPRGSAPGTFSRAV